MKRLLPFVLLLAIVSSACRALPFGPFGAAATPALPPAATITPPPAATKPAEPTAAPPATEPAATEPPTSEPAAEPPDTATTTVPETSSIFGRDPADRSIFAAGLVAAEQRALDELPGAPVYHMAITIDDSLSRLSGRQTVTYTNLTGVPLEEVYFHLHPNTLVGAIEVTDVTVDGAAAAAESVDSAVLRVALPAPLPPDGVTSIDMRFTTEVPTQIGRNYGVLAYYDDILALAHFYPMLAVHDDEGWNIVAPDIQGDLTYSDAAFYLVQVTAPQDVTLVGSGAILEHSGEGDAQTVTYAIGPARDFYLAAGEFVVLSETIGETTVNSYAPAELAEGAAVALDVALASLQSMGERLGPYPYTELDIVTTPTSALGIEYPGLIVGTVNMYDIEGDSGGGFSRAAVLESTTAHEVAHQWFYNLVGNDQLDEPWLDEALVSYATYRYFAGRYGQQTGDRYFENFLGRWERVDREEIPIGLAVAEYEEVEYSAIVYGRGPVFVRALEEEIGRETFDAFLRDYVARFRWGTATSAYFQELAEAHCACDLDPLFAEWVFTQD